MITRRGVGGYHDHMWTPQGGWGWGWCWGNWFWGGRGSTSFTRAHATTPRGGVPAPGGSTLGCPAHAGHRFGWPKWESDKLRGRGRGTSRRVNLAILGVHGIQLTLLCTPAWGVRSPCARRPRQSSLESALVGTRQSCIHGGKDSRKEDTIHQDIGPRGPTLSLWATVSPRVQETGDLSPGWCCLTCRASP